MPFNDISRKEKVQISESILKKIKSKIHGSVQADLCIGYAPGRLEILGNHTDYNGGLVLTIAIQEKTWFGGKKSADQKIRFHALDLNEELEYSSGSSVKALEKSHWGHYLIGVLESIKEDHAIDSGFEVAFTSEVPMAAGCSSSAALTVGFLSFLEALFHLKLSKEYKAKLCQRAENEYTGVQCGLMDQWSVVHGEEDGLIYFDNRSLETQIIPLVNKDLSVVILNTNIKHTLVNSHYNTRRIECNSVVKKCQEAGLNVSLLRDLCSSDIEKHKSLFLENEYKRAMHVAGENERIEHLLKLNERDRMTAIGQLMYDSHESSRTLFENSCDELDAIVTLCATSEYCLGAKLSGGGFGGCVVALVKHDSVDNLIDFIIEEYKNKMPNSPQLSVYKTSIGSGAGSFYMKDASK